MSEAIKEYCEYMKKEAGVNPLTGAWLAFTTGAELTGTALTATLALAALAGAGGGYAASKLTSPGKRDFKNVQREFLRDKLETTVARGERDASLEDMKATSMAAAPKPRSMRL